MDINKAIYKTKGDNDECFTPRYGVEPILQFVPRNMRVWCPFDTESSEFVKVFRENGYQVICSHLSDNHSFLDYCPPMNTWDIIISNPPFTGKRETFTRAFELGKPFILLMSATWLNDAAPIQLYADFGKEMQLIHFDKRMTFKGLEKKIPFKSIYFCSDILPQGNVLLRLDRTV